jgi:hypothetical protein
MRTNYPAIMRATLLALFLSALLIAACSDDEPVTPPAEPDSSSHAFTWEEISIGDDHSYLKDVYALNDTDVWAVGCITTRDTLQSWKPLIQHNALHWDGREWKIVDVPILLPGTGLSFPGPITSVFAFSHDDVWFGTGMVTFWDGKSFHTDETLYNYFPSGVFKMWGRRRDDVYLVGGKGALAHYNGRIFRVLPSGIEYDFNDVWGCGDTALSIASNWLFEKSESVIFRLTNGTAERAYSQDLPAAMKSIWFREGMRRLTIAGGVYREWDGTRWVWAMKQPLRFFIVGLRGASPVDFFIVDQSSGVAHFNGKSWSVYYSGVAGDNEMFAITCTKDQVWAVGCNKIGRTLIIHGKRNPSRR